ncbi:MAG TPA: PAS domain-containing protein, partial [Pelobium sp.]
MAINKISLKQQEEGINIPMGYFWAIFLICIAPTVLSMLGVEISYNGYRVINFSKVLEGISTELVLGKTFSTIWIAFSIAVGIFTCILTIIDFRVKNDIAAPIVGIAMLLTSMFDLVHLLVVFGVLKTNLSLDEAIYMSWFIGRVLQVMLLIIGTLIILRSKNASESKRVNLIRSVAIGFASLTAIAVIALFSLNTLSPLFIQRDAFFTHPFELVSIVLYVIWGAFLMPGLLKKYNGIFFQMLILSMIPAIFANVHMAIFFKNFDIEYNFAQFLCFFTYVVPLLGISLTYSRNIARQHQMNLILDEEIKAKGKIQQDLERRQNLLQNAEKLANMGSWELDVATQEINFSDALYKIFGYMPNSISPDLELMYNMIIPVYRTEYKKMLENAIQKQSSFNTEYEVLWVNGQRRYILAQCR